MARSVLDLMPDMLAVRVEEMRGMLAIMEQHPDLPARDALHASTMLGAGIDTIVTADRHFDMVEGLSRIDPLAC
jgi:predicted nucleic acid-binding protein